MPRTTRSTRSARTAPAVPVRPFADADSLRAFRAAPTAVRAAVAKSVAQAKAQGASGDEMRETFGQLLSGPNRRTLLREHGYDGPTYVARSYDAYRDGDSRKGTQHAREHGVAAQERKAEERAALAATADLPTMRSALRGAAHAVPRSEAKLRAAFRALLDADASAVAAVAAMQDLPSGAPADAPQKPRPRRVRRAA
jgi:hypothetical protein